MRTTNGAQYVQRSADVRELDGMQGEAILRRVKSTGSHHSVPVGGRQPEKRPVSEGMSDWPAEATNVILDGQ
jgi:hypothetical protein